MTKIDRYFAKGQEAFRKGAERGFGVFQKKFHYTCRPVKMLYRDDIFFVVRACVAMHNMMVETRLEEGEIEDASWYKCVQDTTYVRAADYAEQSVNASDAVVAERAAMGDHSLDNDIVDLEFVREYERTMHLPRRMRIAQRRWEMLADSSEHFRLQRAAKRDMYKRQFGNLDDCEEIADDYDPLKY